ncbi:MAG: hypothetical protein R3F46_01645 [bacterium]
MLNRKQKQNEKQQKDRLLAQEFSVLSVCTVVEASRVAACLFAIPARGSQLRCNPHPGCQAAEENVSGWQS